MGTSRDGRVSKNFGTGDNKIKVRFSDERQARRVAVLIEYMKFAFKDGVAEADLGDLLERDFAKANEVIGKIEARHDHEH